MSAREAYVKERGINERSPRCIIIGDVAIYREGLARGLGRLGQVKILVTVGSPEAVAALADYQPDIIVLDISHADTLDIVRPVICSCPELPVVGFGIGGQSDAMRCAEAGISSFVSREDTIEVLEQAVLKAARGEAVCSPYMTARLIRHLAVLADKGSETAENCLTAREREVAALVKKGLSNKEIARALGISPATVKNHVHMILEKLNMASRSSIGMAV